MRINKTFLISGVCLALGGFHSIAVADCAGGSIAEVRQAYANAQKFESRQQFEAALAAYVEAQEYICEKNPYELDAAKKAAALAATLGAAAERKGNLEAAHRFYEAGALYSKSDAALVAWTRSMPDDPAKFADARAHFENRAYESFRSNNALRLSITGAYTVDPAHVASIKTMPAIGVERALKQESEAFDETYLRDYVAVIGTRIEYGEDGAPSPLDQTALSRTSQAHEAFARKWPEEPLKKSRARLETLYRWGEVSRDTELTAAVRKSYRERIDRHVDLMVQRYSGAPKLLDEAIDYVRLLAVEGASVDGRVKSIQLVASKLGDNSQSRKRFSIAAEYFDVADDEVRAQTAQDMLKQAMQAKLQPSMDAMQRQAAQIQAQFSDPERIKAMKAQAEAARTGLQQQPASRKQSKSADDLEKELGL